MAGSTDRNRSRERMRQEVEYLRETVVALEAQLAHRRTQQQHQKLEYRGDDVGASATERAQQIADAAWQDIAERQRRLRYEAEVENNRLRGFLEDQIRLGKTLEKLLHRRQHTEVESMLARRLDTHCDPQGATNRLLDSASLVRELHASLREQLAKASGVFENECFASDGQDTSRRIDLRYRDEVGTFVETSERRVFPFDERTVSDAILQQFDALNPRTVVVQDAWTRENDCLAFDLTTMIDTVRFRGVSRTKLLIQRVVQSDCTLFLYAGASDPGESLGTPCDGLFVRHRGWVRLRALADPATSPHVTEYLTYHIATPEVHDVVADQKRKIGTLTNYVLATIGFQMDVGKESIDNYLLAHAGVSSASRRPSPRDGVPPTYLHTPLPPTPSSLSV